VGVSRIVKYGSMLSIFVILSGPCRSAPDMEVRKVVLPDGRHLAFGTMGSGKDTVVVLHGGPGLQMQYLVREWSRLAEDRTLVFYDQRGRGLSDFEPEDSISLSQDADDLESLRSALGLSHFSIAAHHSGAMVAVLYARRHPERTGRLLLVSPAFARRSFYFWAATEVNDSTATLRLTRAMQAGENVADPAAFCRKYWGFWFSPVEVTDPAVVSRLAPGICDARPERLLAVDKIGAAVFKQLYQFNLHDSLAAVGVPALVVQGSGDEAFSASAQTWAAWLPQGRELIVSGTSSPLFPWIGAESSFFPAATEFLGGRWPAAAHQVGVPLESVTASSPVK